MSDPLTIFCVVLGSVCALGVVVWALIELLTRAYVRGFDYGYQKGWEDKELGNDKYVEF